MNKHQQPIGHARNSEAIKSVTVDGTKLSLAEMIKDAALDPKVDKIEVHLNSTGSTELVQASIKTHKK